MDFRASLLRSGFRCFDAYGSIPSRKEGGRSKLGKKGGGIETRLRECLTHTGFPPSIAYACGLGVTQFYEEEKSKRSRLTEPKNKFPFVPPIRWIAKTLLCSRLPIALLRATDETEGRDLEVI